MSSAATRHDDDDAAPRLAGGGSRAPLTDVDVVAAFHVMLKDALAQARAEGLLADDDLARAPVELEIAAPALCLCFAALQAGGWPPAIRAPDGRFVLDSDSCPPSFAGFFAAWQGEVLAIQQLPLDARHDLIRILCDREPLQAPRPDVARIAATLKSIAINLVQRRTFQLLFADDLQHALNSGVRARTPSPAPPTASASEAHPRAQPRYQPPPSYEPQPSTSAAPAPPPPVPPRPSGSLRVPGPTGSLTRPTSTSHLPTDDPNLTLIRETLLAALADVLATTPSIRTLLAERGQEWASHAYFACLCLAILDVALDRVTPSGGVRCVQLGGNVPGAAGTSTTKSGKIIGMGDCPLQLRRLLWALSNIGAKCQRLAEDDLLAAIKLVEEQDRNADAEQAEAQADAARRAGNLEGEGRRSRPTSTDSTAFQTNRIERLRYRLEHGTDQHAHHRRSADDGDDDGDGEQLQGAAAPTSNSSGRVPGAGTARLATSVAEVANDINQLALAFFQIPTFRERQREAFKVLQGVRTL